MATDAIFQVTREELIAHMGARIQHHESRAAELSAKADEAEKQAEAVLAQGETVTDRLRIKNDSAYSGPMGMRDRLRDDAIKHNRKAQVFRFYVDHVMNQPVFTGLTAHDLANLEFIPAQY